MVTDAERKAALLAMETLKANLQRIGPRADGNYNAGDLAWAIDETIKDLQNKYDENNPEPPESE